LQTQKPSPPSPRQQQAKKKLLQPMFAKSGDEIAVLDRAGHVIEVNDSACQLFGRSRRAFVGKTLENFSKTTLNLQPTLVVNGRTARSTIGQIVVVCLQEVERKVEYKLTYHVTTQLNLSQNH
jgi:PAS domain-containing protein